MQTEGMTSLFYEQINNLITSNIRRSPYDQTCNTTLPSRPLTTQEP